MQTQVSKQANKEARSAQPSRQPYIIVTKRSSSKTSVDFMNALQHRKTTRVPLTPVFANGSRLDHPSSTLPNKAPPNRVQRRPSTGVGFSNAPWRFLRRRNGWDAASLQCIRVNSDMQHGCKFFAPESPPWMFMEAQWQLLSKGGASITWEERWNYWAYFVSVSQYTPRGERTVNTFATLLEGVGVRNFTAWRSSYPARAFSYQDSGERESKSAERNSKRRR